MACKCMLCFSKIPMIEGEYYLSQDRKDIIICKSCYYKKQRMFSNAKSKNEIFLDAFDFFDAIYNKNKIEPQVKKELLKVLSLIDGGLEKTYELIEEKEAEEREEEERQRLQEIEEHTRELELIEEKKKNRKDFMITNGFNFEGYVIKKYIKIVNGECVLGTGFLSELSGQINDFFGTNSSAFSEKMRLAKNAAQKNMIEDALNEHANAIIGVDFDVITIGNNMLAVSVNGTAVKIDKIKDDSVK